LKASWRPFYAHDATLIQIGYNLALEPLTVSNEVVERDRCLDLNTMSALVCVERQRTVRICDVRSHPGGAQVHAGWHMLLPERHWLAKHARVHAG
jgi:hypothetical protein